MPIAEILTIGTEILLGEIQDTNTAFIAHALKDMGIDLYRTQTVGDNSARITAIIQDILQRADILVTTGGLGPTVDDPTRQAVADALGVPLVFNDSCWEHVQSYFQRLNRPMPENNRRQAYIPQGAEPILNPVGTAPGFIVDTGEKNIISVPGVPKEMEHLVIHNVGPYLRQRWNIHTVIRTRVMHTSGLGEALLDGMVGEYEQWTNPTVGLLAKAGIVDIRIGAKAETEIEADQMIDNLIQILQPKLGNHFFGLDQTSLADVIKEKMEKFGKPVIIKIQGLEGKLSELFSPYSIPNLEILDTTIQARFTTRPLHELDEKHLVFHFDLDKSNHPAELHTVIIQSLDEMSRFTRKYGGPPAMADAWAINCILDTIRLTLLDQLEPKG